MIDARQQRLCADLSRLLAYPAADAGALARRAAEGAGAGSAAGAALARFAEAAEGADPGALQELYTATFDLRPTCAPYVGVQLLGDESPVRGALLARLAEVYAAEGFRPREELGDHVAEVLGFLAVARPGPGRDDLLRDGLLPALTRMIEALEDRGNPYRDLLVAAGAAFEPGAAGAEVGP